MLQRRSVLAALTLLAAAACGDETTASSSNGLRDAAPGEMAPLYVGRLGSRVAPDIYSVIYKHDVVNGRALTAHLRHDLKFNPRHEWDESWMKGFSAKLTAKDVEKLRRHPHVSYVSRVLIGRAGSTQIAPPNWGLDRIDQRQLPLNQQYVYTDSAPNVIAYIIDTGIRRTHQEFEGRAFLGIDVVTDGGTDIDCAGHGTDVASVVGGRQYGVAKKVSVYSVRIQDCNGGGLHGRRRHRNQLGDQRSQHLRRSRCCEPEHRVEWHLARDRPGDRGVDQRRRDICRSRR